MRMRFCSAGLSLAVLLVAGCGTVTRDSGMATAKDSARAITAPADDYSTQGVTRRTEAHTRYSLGFLHELNEQPELAAQEYALAALADPTNTPLVAEAVARLLRFKKNDEALDLLKKATATPDASGELFAQLGLVYSLLGKKEAAGEANRQAIKKSPRSLIGYRHLAQIHLQERQFAEGLKVLDQAAKQPDTDVLFLAELGEFYLAFARAGTNDQVKARALDTFERAAKLNPTHPFLLQKLGDGFALLGEADKAADMYLKLVERFPNLPDLREKLADIYLRKQDRTRAAEQLEAIIREQPTNPQAHYFLGSIAFEEKNMKEAVGHFRKVMLLNPAFEPVYYDLAGAQINLGEPREALDTLAKARAKFPQNFVGEFYTALAHTRLKAYSNAITHFVAAEVIGRSTATNRLTHTFYFQLGAAHERNQQFEDAERNFEKCLSLAPDFSEALNYLGYMWADRGVNLPRARELIEKAVKLEPKNAAYLDSLGWVLYKLDQPKEALRHLLKALEFSEEPDATLHDHLGDIYHALKQPEKARDAWRKALTFEPNEHREQIQKKLGAAGAAGTPPLENVPR